MRLILVFGLALIVGCSQEVDGNIASGITTTNASTSTRNFIIGDCDHRQEYASYEFVKFCVEIGKEQPLEPCIVGQEQNSARDVIIAAGGGGAYLEVYDCAWHSGKNPRTTNSGE